MWLSIFGHTHPQSPNQQILKQGQRKLKKINSAEIFMEATWIESWQLRTCLDARQLRKVKVPGAIVLGSQRKEIEWEKCWVTFHLRRLKMVLYSLERNNAKFFLYTLEKHTLSLNKGPIISFNCTFYSGWISHSMKSLFTHHFLISTVTYLIHSIKFSSPNKCRF